MSTIAKARHLFRFLLPLSLAPITHFAEGALDDLVLSTWDIIMGLPEHTTASHLVAKHLLQLPIGLGCLGFTSEQHFGDAALFAAIVTAKRVRELLFPAAPQKYFPIEAAMAPLDTAGAPPPVGVLPSGLFVDFETRLTGAALLAARPNTVSKPRTDDSF